MTYADPVKEITFTDKYGDARAIHRTRHGLQVKRTNLTPVIKLNQAMAALVGDRIRALRIERGYGLAELCERAGIVSATPKSRMWELENAVRKEGMRLGTLYALAIALDVEVCELLPTTDEVRKIVALETAPQTRLVTK